MKHITSLHNPEIKKLIKLQTAQGRKKYQQFIAQGIRTITGLLDSSFKLIALYSTEEYLDSSHNLISSTTLNTATIVIISNAILKKAGTVSTPSGVIGVFALPAQPSWDMLTSGLVLANINDPGNMGTLIRTAVAIDLKTVVITHESADPWSPKVIQASAGAISSVTIFQCSWKELIEHKKNLQIYGLVIHKGKSLHTINAANSLIVVGNEAHGLPQEWQDTCDSLISLPMPGNTESLNAAIAGSIALYIMHVYSKTHIC